MIKLVVLACVGAACGEVPRTGTDTKDLTSVAKTKLLEVLASHDLHAIEQALQVPVMYGGLWFSDPGCTRAFPQPGQIAEARVPAFAACLAGLSWRDSARKHMLFDIGIVQYGPGIEVEMRFSFVGGAARVVWIGYSGHRDPKDALPTITAETLEALRVEAAPLGPETRAALVADAKLDRLDQAFAWLRLCLDAEGAISNVRAIEATSSMAAEAFVAAAASWKFKPLAIGGTAIPACAFVRASEPADHEVEWLPLRGASETDVSVAAIAVKRASGEPNIVPDDRDKITLSRAGDGGTISGAFRFCLDPAGHVTTVSLLEPTGLPNYDAKLERGIHRWTYEPINVGRHSGPICTTVTFVYSQR